MVIPDTVLMQKVEELELKAATVSSGVLGGMLGNPGVAREYQVRLGGIFSLFGLSFSRSNIAAHVWDCRWR